MSRRIIRILIIALDLAVIVAVACAIGAFVNVIRSEAAGRIENGEYIVIDDEPQEEAIDINEAPPINEVSEALDEVDANGHQMEYLGTFTTTFYCSCSRCNGKWGAIDGFGEPLKWGCVAVDKSVIPLHTKLVIDGYDTLFEARDTGSGVDGKHIDIYVPVSHSEALAMPNGQKVNVWKWIE